MQIAISPQINLAEQIDWTDKDPLIKPERKDIIAISGERGGLQIRTMELLLDWYYQHHHINFHQHHAGFKFFRLWHFTAFRDRYVKCNYGAEIRGDIDFQDMAIIPYQYLEAKMAIAKPHARMVVIDICCRNVNPGRRKLSLLKEGLDDLIIWFKKSSCN